MDHGMILSASGWRKVFAKSGREDDTGSTIGETNSFLSLLAAEAFAEFLIDRTGKRTGKKAPRVVVARDTRPTGEQIVQNAIKALVVSGVRPIYLGVACAPEVMAAAKDCEGFLYVSASHNPIGHNGLKFGLADGGVLSREDSSKLIGAFEAKCEGEGAGERALGIAIEAEQKHKGDIEKVYADAKKNKAQSLATYAKFSKTVITGCDKKAEQQKVFSRIKRALQENPLSVVCDLNGSARGTSIDGSLFAEVGVELLPFNTDKIAHGIIPEGENLAPLAERIRELQTAGKTSALLGFMSDCDGDRGNTVFWDGKVAHMLEAQEGFALCVVSELCYELWQGKRADNLAVVVNCATSMRVDDICRALGAAVFRSEVGEANVVNLARQKRAEGFNVRIFGEGSNGGNITWPSAVRDPLSTVFALIKLLTLRDEKGKLGLYHLWLERSGQGSRYKADFTLADVLDSLPKYTTTGVSEQRASMHISAAPKATLKPRFRECFLRSWEEHKEELAREAGIASFRCFLTNGTVETADAPDWGNGTGGLKLKFQDGTGEDVAFMWFRPSGTENVLRLLCDVKGEAQKIEGKLLEWERQLITDATQGWGD